MASPSAQTEMPKNVEKPPSFSENQPQSTPKSSETESDFAREFRLAKERCDVKNRALREIEDIHQQIHEDEIEAFV